MKVTMSVTFNDENERDRELLHRLRAEPNRSAAVRVALSEHYGRKVTLDDVYRQLEALRDMADRGLLQLSHGQAAIDGEPEPPDLADALDKLGL